MATHALFSYSKTVLKEFIADIHYLKIEEIEFIKAQYFNSDFLPLSLKRGVIRACENQIIIKQALEDEINQKGKRSNVL